MSKYYFEGSPILAPLTFTSNDVVISSETANLKMLIHKTDAHRWDLTFGIVANNNEADIFLAMIENEFTVKTMIMPQLKSVEDATTLSGPLNTSQNLNKGSSEVRVTNSSGGLLPKGSFIQFSNHTKIYITKQDWSSEEEDLVFYPNLRVTVNSNTVVRFASPLNSDPKPILNYRRDGDSLTGITYNDGILASIGSLTVKEVV